MKLTFIETPLFSRLLPEYLDDEDYRLLQQALLAEPEMGMVIPGRAASESCVGRTNDGERGSEGGVCG